MAGVWACAKVDDSVDLDLAGDTGSTVDGGIATDAGICSMHVPVSRLFVPADILILFDRSASMDMVHGTSTRYHALADVLVELVRSYAAFVHFGYQEMPGRQGCDAFAIPGCCASPPSVRLAADNAGLVTAAIAAAPPADGNTPTAGALDKAYDYYRDLHDGIANRYVLLATDGAPNCTLAGKLSSRDTFEASGKRQSGACYDAVDRIISLRNLGVQVIVLGLGVSEVDTSSDVADCLEDMARAGSALGPNEGPSYHSADTVPQLHRTIEQIFADAPPPSCIVQLPYRPDASQPITVFLDGQSIPRVEMGDGWWLDNSTIPPAVRVCGAYCDRMQRFQVGRIDVVFGCGASIEPIPGVPLL